MAKPFVVFLVKDYMRNEKLNSQALANLETATSSK